MTRDSGLDLDRVREVFEESKDFTIGLEEEFAILDRDSLDLVPGFETLREAARSDEVLSESIAGELISSEIEIRSGRSGDFAEAGERQAERRARLFRLAAEQGFDLAATGAHPWADYREQRIIDTPHYRRVEDELQWVARRNNTWSLHVHVGVRGADRAIAVCDHLRGLLPLLLAASANSPYLEGTDTGLASIRTQIFTRTFPRCGIPGAFGDWRKYASFVDLLARTGSIVESTQLWWSVRPHHAFGTVEIRICDAQSDGERSTALAGLIAAVTAQLALDYDRYGYADSGQAPFGPGAGTPALDREVEENLWRAIRNGVAGETIDFADKGRVVGAAESLTALREWSRPAAERLRVGPLFEPRDEPARFRQTVVEAGGLREGYREIVNETRRTYAGAGQIAAAGRSKPSEP